MRVSKRSAAGLVAGLRLPHLSHVRAATTSPSLVIYNAQHEELIDEVAAQFTEGDRHRGRAAQRLGPRARQPDRREGDALAGRRVPHRELAGDVARRQQGPVHEARPDDAGPDPGRSTGPTTGLDRLRRPRSTVLVYNTDESSEADLPDLDHGPGRSRSGRDASPSRPTGADFQAIVSAVLRPRARRPPRTGSTGLKANGTVYEGNNVVMNSVNDGQVETGVIYHYYWYRDQEESGENSDNSKLHFFGNQDPGAFISVSGAGVLKASKTQKDAQKFVDYLAGVGRPAGHRRQLRAGVHRSTPTSTLEPRRQAALRARPAGGRRLRAQRAEGRSS